MPGIIAYGLAVLAAVVGIVLLRNGIREQKKRSEWEVIDLSSTANKATILLGSGILLLIGVVVWTWYLLTI